MSKEAGHEAADQCPAEPGVEGLGQRGGLHPDGLHLPHADGAAPHDGAQSQAGLPGVHVQSQACPGRGAGPHQFSCVENGIFFFFKPTNAVGIFPGPIHAASAGQVMSDSVTPANESVDQATCLESWTQTFVTASM